MSTPRSGNTWARILVSYLFQIPHLSADAPADVDWSGLPESCSLQIHWNRTPGFRKLLEDHDFRVLSLARHPLDVVISILHFARHEVTHWLDHNHQALDERKLVDATPASAEFLEYATGPRAARLLGVTTDWWDAPEVHRVRYETLVANPVDESYRLCAFLGSEPVVRVEDAVEATTIERLRPLVNNNHFWQGSPGLWRRLLTTDRARRIALAHDSVFGQLGYACDPDELLTSVDAEANWRRLLGTAYSS